MIKLFRSHGVSADNNILETCRSVLNIFDIKHTKWKLNNSIADHLEAQSLLAVKDILTEYSVESAAIHKSNYSYVDFETPFICAIQQEDWPKSAFTMVNHCDGEKIIYLDPMTNRFKKSSIEEFEKIDKEIILLLDGAMAKDEVNYSKNTRLETTDHIVKLLPLFLIIAVFSFSISKILMQGFTLSTLIGAIFLTTSLTGMLVSFLLIRYDINSHDPFVKEVCGAFGKKSDCTSVLSSKQSSFLGISWSIWGFSFYASFFVSQVIFIGQSSNLILWIFLSILMSPYFIFSVYYQWLVVKQWCPLCLLVQGLIVTDFLISIIYFQFYSIDFTQINSHHLLVVLFLGAAFMLLVYFTIPVIKRANDSKEYRSKWMKLRYNPSIFNSLLEKK